MQIKEKLELNAEFHDDAQMVSNEWKAAEPEEEAAENMLKDMEPEPFATILRKLQDSVDDDFFGSLFQELMAKMHKMAPKFKAAVHEIYSRP